MTACGICGGDGLVPMFQARDENFHTTDELFTIERCPVCGAAQTIPPAAVHQVGSYYPQSYYPTVVLDASRYERNIGRFQKEKLDFVRRFRSGGKLLDIGCGAGYFLREVVRAGFDAEGVELSREAAEFGRTQWGLRIAEGDALSVSLPEASYDVITMWQVLEHVLNVRETLNKVHALLRPGGILVVAVPNIGSWQARLFRGRWYHLDVPRHQFHFDPSTLRTLLGEHGFSVVGESRRSAEHNWAGIMGSMIEFSPPRITQAGKAFRRFIARPLAGTASWIEEMLGSGGTFTLSAERR
ncbi:MAG: class I SAM-dependent methyltransferase [Bacteroidota bacterium]